MWSFDDLVVAPATPAGPGGRAIVRLGGAGLERLLATLFAPVAGGFPRAGEPPRLVDAVPARDGPLAPLGRMPVGILHWPGPGGPIGQPLAEVQLPASEAAVAAVVRAACDQGARLARGGEFSLRSFLAGRLGLLEAEGVLAVVDSRTPAELSAALDRMAGGVGRELAAVRESLLDLAADIEAAIDFADERTPDAVPAAAEAETAAVLRRLAEAAAAIDRVAARLDARDSSAAAAVPRVVFVGQPNIGKSSLVNALTGRDATLVADEAGTTRDWVAVPLDGGDDGPGCLLVDVAGLDVSAVGQGSPLGGSAGPLAGAAEPMARAAERVARAELARADVIVACRDAASAPLPAPPAAGRPEIRVATRCDRGPPAPAHPGECLTSARTGAGLDDLRRRIRQVVAALAPAASPATLRLAAGLAGAGDALARASAAAAGLPAGPADEAVVAGIVREAVARIGEVTGAEIADDLVDRIFSRHCIGK